MEHENLISDSEYITLQHQTGENTTHIQTTALEQKLDTLTQAVNVLDEAVASIISGGGSAPN